MKANKFVKENGIEKCKRILDDLTDQGHTGDFYKELKRLIESHELVKSYGGMDQTGFFADMESNDILAARMYEAIADVESCQ